MPSRRDMSRSDKTKRPRMRLSSSDKSALQSADALIGPDAAREAQKSKTVLLFGDEVKGFNYGSLPSDVANEARIIASELRKAADNYHYRVGQQLTAIRPKFEHGQWEVWVVLEVGFSPQVCAQLHEVRRLRTGVRHRHRPAFPAKRCLSARQRTRLGQAATDPTGEGGRAHLYLGCSAGRT